MDILDWFGRRKWVLEGLFFVFLGASFCLSLWCTYAYGTLAGHCKCTGLNSECRLLPDHPEQGRECEYVAFATEENIVWKSDRIAAMLGRISNTNGVTTFYAWWIVLYNFVGERSWNLYLASFVLLMVGFNSAIGFELMMPNFDRADYHGVKDVKIKWRNPWLLILLGVVELIATLVGMFLLFVLALTTSDGDETQEKYDAASVYEMRAIPWEKNEEKMKTIIDWAM